MCRLLLILVVFFGTTCTYAQCAMCRAALESGDSGISAEAVNDGIVYLMIWPYLLVAIIAYVVYRLRKTKTD